MQICKTKLELKQKLKPWLEDNKVIGLVPTMGALHEGHLSLIEESVKDNDLTIASIFVNPTQFNNPEDLDKYPRNLDQDLALLDSKGCDIVFAPTKEEMYPEKDNRQFSFEGIELGMEGAHRPGHFNGVAQIVSKLFDVVPASNAYFGLKDYQQLAVIKHLVNQLGSTIKVIPCPTVREDDGLAMSSRNMRLKRDYRIEAPLIYRTLKLVEKELKTKSIIAIKELVKGIFENNALLELEYFEIVDDMLLQPMEVLSTEKPAIACIAVWAGDVRLIDNIQINL